MRVSLAGGGTDLPPFVCDGGEPAGRVLSAAIDLEARVELELTGDDVVELVVTRDGPAPASSTHRRAAHEPASREPAFRLIEAALAREGVRGGAWVRVTSPVATGSGLGASASVAVALLAALRAALGATLQVSPHELATAALSLEREGLGLACGAQDPMVAAHGGVLDLVFDTRGDVTARSLELEPSTRARLGGGLLLVDTGRQRVSGEVLARATNDAHALVARAELVRAARDATESLVRGDLEQLFEAMRRNARVKHAHDPHANELALALARALEGLEVEVVRTCGAGEGGHVLVWAPPSQHLAIEQRVKTLGLGPVRSPRLATRGVRATRGRAPEPRGPA